MSFCGHVGSSGGIWHLAGNGPPVVNGSDSGKAYKPASWLGKLFGRGQASPPPRAAQARQARHGCIQVSTRRLASKTGKLGKLDRSDKPGQARQARASLASPASRARQARGTTRKTGTPGTPCKTGKPGKASSRCARDLASYFRQGMASPCPHRVLAWSTCATATPPLPLPSSRRLPIKCAVCVPSSPLPQSTKDFG
eukprot:gene18980-biopygen20490